MAAAGADPRALDVEEQQVAIFFEGDAYEWHHRLLMVSGGAGRWVVMTPDLDLESEDLTQHIVVALTRGAPVPARIRRSFYAFDEVDEADLRRLRTEARQLAKAIGFDVTALAKSLQSRWLIADTAHADFGTEPDASLIGDPDTFVERGASGLVNLASYNGIGVDEWVFVENIGANDEADWKNEKVAGPGRDERVLRIKKNPRGARKTTLSEALAQVTVASRTDWPFRGPSAVMEFLEGIDSTGLDLAGYYGHWQTTSGVHSAAGVAIELKHLIEVMRHLIVHDQVNVGQLAGAEMVARRCLQIQRAVRRSARHPCFDGLEAMMSSALDETGGVVTSKFDEYVAKEQKQAAEIMKQQRLWHDERDNDDKNKDKADPTPEAAHPAPRAGKKGKRE